MATATTQQGLSREDIMHILKGMNIDLSRNSKLSLSKLDDHLGKALDAAQRFSNIFPPTPPNNTGRRINLSKYSRWKKRAPVVDAFTRRTWGAIFQDNNRGFDDPRQIAFARINQLIPDIGKEMDKQKLGYVVLKDSIALRALIIRFFSIYEINEKTPLVLINYSTLAEDTEEDLNEAVVDYSPEEQRGRAYQMTEVEQNLLIKLLAINRHHISPDFRIPLDLTDEDCEPSFILPIGGLNMKDMAKLSRIQGCILCGEKTHNTCSACLYSQYCSKEHQREDWKSHRALCKALSSGKWFTVTLEPNPFSAMMQRMYKTSINRYDDDGGEGGDAGIPDNAEWDDVPPNYYDNEYYLVKVQLPVGGEANQMLVYDRFKTIELHLTEVKNPEAFTMALLVAGGEPKIYRWVRREADWDWKICFDRAPDHVPTW